VSSGGKEYYEIYLRRERVSSLAEEDEDSSKSSSSSTKPPVKGLNTFCLISRDEVPQGSGNLFQFADIDRDGMIDMLYVNSNNLNLTVHYNKLLNV